MTDDATAIDLLLAVRHDLVAAGSPRAEWFAERLDAWLAGEAPSLDRAFDVAAPGPGARTAIQCYFRQQRDDALYRAFEFVHGGPQAARVKTLHQYAVAMAAQWDELRVLERPDPSWSGLRTSLWWALMYAEKAGRPIPGEKRLSTIVADPESHDLGEVVG